MAKNARQRRPLQDETRSEKRTVRERAQVSRRQRDRIEENRDRREQRRERNRLRRQQVDSIRSPKEDVRTERTDSRLIPVEDTFLGRPVGEPKELPVVIGERWDLQTNQSLANASFEDVEFATPVFTTERNGYPALYDTSTRKFTIPGGLAGIWWVHFWGTVDALSHGTIIHRILLNGVITGYVEMSSGTDGTGVVSNLIKCSEGDEIQIQASQYTGGAVDLLGSAGFTGCWLVFHGK